MVHYEGYAMRAGGGANSARSTVERLKNWPSNWAKSTSTPARTRACRRSRGVDTRSSAIGRYSRPWWRSMKKATSYRSMS